MTGLPLKVDIKLVVISIHEVDTLNEKFTAEIYIESRWPLECEINGELECKAVGKNWRPKWTPDLYIQNLVTKEKCKCWYKIGEFEHKKYVFEMKRLKVTIYEKFELKYYPFDLQVLNINIISNHSNANCILQKTNLLFPSYIHSENFRDSQEWYLYNYIGSQDNLIHNTEYSIDTNEHSQIRFYCAVARNANYFIWNSFFIILLLASLGFTAFSFPYTLTSNRLSTTMTLVLSSISFKWVINRNLPPIPYLTTIDVYSINLIAFLAFLACWHVLIGYFHDGTKDFTWIDRGFLIAIAGLFLIYHGVYFSYLYIRNFAPRRLYTEFERGANMNRKLFSLNNSIKFNS